MLCTDSFQPNFDTEYDGMCVLTLAFLSWSSTVFFAIPKAESFSAYSFIEDWAKAKASEPLRFSRSRAYDDGM